MADGVLTALDETSTLQTQDTSDEEPSTKVSKGGSDELSRLRALGADVKEQDDVERYIGRQADQLLAEQAVQREQTRLEKTRSDKNRLELQVRRIQAKLNQRLLPPAATVRRLQSELDNYLAQLEAADNDIREIESRVQEKQDGINVHGEEGLEKDGKLLGESQRDFLIRTGKITPFSRLARPVARVTADLRETLLDAEEDRPTEQEEPDEGISRKDGRSHVHLKRPGFAASDDSTSSAEEHVHRPLVKRRRVYHREAASQTTGEEIAGVDTDSAASEFNPEHGTTSEDEQLPIESDDDEGEFQPELSVKMKRRNRKAAKKSRSNNQTANDSEEVSDILADTDELADVDDGNEDHYQQRLAHWTRRRNAARARARAKRNETSEMSEMSHEPEWAMPHPDVPDLELEDDYRLPGDVHPALFDYQKTGVEWLSQLYKSQVGGIIGDEMGLGKTIQIIAFLAGLHYSKKVKGPIIIVCPATVMKQWVKEFHAWWPAFRVCILHSSGSGMIDPGRESRKEDALLDRDNTAGNTATAHNGGTTHLTRLERSVSAIVDKVIHDGHVLVTTYAGLQTYAEFLIPVDWNYAVLDEGHTIRNPNASITIHCKELRTANRIILSGTPIQNNLVELWSLFDFIYPMRLGTLVDFRNEFDIPIRQGGFARASNLQVMTATKCAETLKEAIRPYLLQRLKIDVATDLPKKSELILFCDMTEKQRLAYKNFLKGGGTKNVHESRNQLFLAVGILRKICNHPDLADWRILTNQPSYKYGDPKASGKMVVVKELLDLWKMEGHKALLFCQTRLMLDILQDYVKSMDGINYLRMDGNTAIKERQKLVDKFNTDPALHVFLLTTKVGGLGVNLTGADRVILFDPDWNPSVDIQARERAWRLGQKREVHIYRLMIKGSIEEKIYHRQIFKQFLTNKVLKDPKQQNSLDMKDLYDLFTLDDQHVNGTETGQLFEGSETNMADSSESRPAGGPVANATDVRRSTMTKDHGTDDVRHSLTRTKPTADSSHDLSAVKGILSIEDGEQIELESEGKDKHDAEKRILTGIFQRSGVTSTVEHDRIVNGRIEYAADPKMLNREAEKIAAQAAKSLRRAEQLAKETPVGVPTWTGEAGSAGRHSASLPPQPPPPPRGSVVRSIGGANSASVLSGLRDRKNDNAWSGNHNGPRASSESTRASGLRSRHERETGTQGSTAEQFGKMIIDFLHANNGTVVTQMLINQFRHQVKTAKQSAEFNAMLSEIATVRKGQGGRGRWTIKPEYRK